MLHKPRSLALPHEAMRPEASRSPRVERLVKGSHPTGSEVLQVIAVVLLYLLIGVGIIVVPIVILQVMGIAGF